MNFLAIATLNSVRSCVRLPISMMPRFSLKLTLARLRTGIDNAGSRLRAAAVITVSATPTSFLSTGPGFFTAALAMGSPLSALRCALSRFQRLFGRRGLFGRTAVARLGARQPRRLPFGAFKGDDDRVRQTLRAALVAEDLVGLGPAGALERDLLQLALELFLRELTALQPRTRLDDLFDVELENIAPAELALGPLALSQEYAEPAPAFLQRQPDLLADLVVIGDRLFRLAGERHPDRGHLAEHHHRPRRERPARLDDAIISPGGLEHRLEGRARRLLIEQRDAVGVANDAGQLVVVVLLLAFGQRDGRSFRRRRRLIRSFAERQSRLDDERITAVHCRWPGHRRVEVALDLLVEAVEDRLLADRRDAVGRRRHDLGGLDRLVERLGVGAVKTARLRVGRELRRLADLLGDGGGHPAELAREKPGEPVALGVVEHAKKNAELDAVWMRLDLVGLARQLLDRPRILSRLPLRRAVDELHVRIGDGHLLEIFVHRGAALLVAPVDLQRHLRAARVLPVDLLVLENPRFVLLCIDLDFKVVGGGPRACARDDLHRLARRQLSVHACGGDTDALLAPAHS